MPKKSAPSEFDPLGRANEQEQKRYKRKANKAHSSAKTAIELKCLECCAFDRKEVKECRVLTCPLWAWNRKIYGDSPGPALDSSPSN